MPPKETVWLWYLACVVFGFGFVSPPSVLAYIWWRFALAATLGAHLAEFFFVRELFAKIGGDQRGHFVNTVLYGFLYWVPLSRKAKAARGKR